ncbi:type III pantothenate kinase [Helicobacter baculiformis]|uniref:Type III pantothenate kinase n=1 Tax=Helicobacter baculiformis TaxID=427351 RepID=A0ABV7ZMP7_9HELI|nr:type III pantothenate kinase [Helicobacter baculiformis]
MILCDIGNSALHFYDGKRVWHRTPDTLEPFTEPLHYISVNPTFEHALLDICPHAHNLEPQIKLESSYKGLGVDRKAACLGLGDDGVVVDAGSAITIDVMEKGMHLGGVILPGFKAYHQAYQSISEVLDHPINVRIDLESLPQSTAQALSYGALKSILLVLEGIIGKRRVVFTGGDGEFLSAFFTRGVYHKWLVFEGMRRALA